MPPGALGGSLGRHLSSLLRFQLRVWLHRRGAANWHSSYIDAISYALRRTRHRKLLDKWRHEVGSYDVAIAGKERN
jgi:hypothetical protein